MSRLCRSVAVISLALVTGLANAQAPEGSEACGQFPELPVVDGLPGEAEFRVLVTLRSGRPVALELGVLKGYSDRAAMRKAISALESHFRDHVRCPGLSLLRMRVRMAPGTTVVSDLHTTQE